MKRCFLAHSKLYLLAAVYLLLTIAYNVTIPLARGDDEFGHFRYVRFIAEHQRLPLNLSERGQASYVSIYSPLYYGLAAVLFAGIDSQQTVFKQIKYGEVSQQALMQEVLDIHWILQTDMMNYPYRGAVLLWHLSRFFSSLLSAGVLIVTYFTVLELFPGRKSYALLASASLVFIPRFIYTSATVNNDNMVALLMAVYLFLLVRVVKGQQRWWSFVLVGLALGLGVVTKFSIGLAPLTLTLFFCFLAWRQRWGVSVLLKRVGLVALSAFLVSSWWFVFLVWNFADLKTQGPVAGIFNAIVPQVATNVSGADFLDALQTSAGTDTSLRFGAWLAYLIKSFWAVSFSTDLNVFPLFPGVYGGILLVVGLTLLGLVKFWRRGAAWQRLVLVLCGFHLLSFPPLMLIRYTLNGRIFETAQGRHILMPAALAIAILLAAGWSSWTSARAFKWLRPVLPTMLVFWSLVQLYLISQTYPAPLPLLTNPAAPPPVDTPVGQLFFNAFEFIGYTTHLAADESRLEVKLVWQAHSPSPKDYMSEVRLLDADGQVVSSWLKHPADGYYPTRVWVKGEVIYDQAELPLYHLAPGVYTLEAYLREAYQPSTRPAAGPLFSKQITLSKRGDDYPYFKTLSVLAGHETSSINYQLWPFNFFNFSRPRYHYRAAIPLLWRAALSPDQKLALSLVAPDGRVFDPLLAQGNVKTFIVAADWPAGLYRLKAQITQQGEVIGEAVSAPLLDVDNQPRQFAPPPISRPVEANFYNYIKLLGYDLPKTRLKPGEELAVLTHWQDLQVVNADLLMFNHLYDRDNRPWASFDHILPPYYGGVIMWTPGEIVSDGYTIPIPPDTPAGIYTLQVGLFLKMGDNAWLPAPLVNAGQISEITYVTLGPIKIGASPAEVLAAQPHPRYARDDNLGNQIKLRGYDLSASPDKHELKITLYWENLAPAEKDYITFIHLQDEKGKIVTQKDGPPANGAYPTSLWDTGEVIRDEITLPLPTNLTHQRYELLVGMYDFSTGERLAVLPVQQNFILLTSFAGELLP